MRDDFARVVAEHDTIICAGSGGVGKTTTSAAIALWGAMQGRRTVVLTIDPARRLADSMGIQLEGGGEAEVSAEVLRKADLEVPGRLSAMMLDQKGAWDALIERHAPSPEVRDRILRNRFYQNLSESFAGSQEYMAIEELCTLQESGRYDLIVVDTPPSRHALDFLEAPRRMGDFLDEGAVRWFVKPGLAAGWSGMRLMNRTVGFVMNKLEEATGVGVLGEVSEFFDAMSGIFDGFSERLARVYRVLRGSGTAFVLVTSPEEQVLEEAEYLSERMGSLGMPLRAVVFNRVHGEYVPSEELAEFPRRDLRWEDRDALESLLGRLGASPESFVANLAENFLRYQDLGRGEELRLEQFAAALSGEIPVLRVPNFDTDLHRLDSLARMHPYLFDREPS